MKLQLIQLSKLIAYDNNPRNNDSAVDAVAASIKEFGFKVPIVITSDYVIVAGHTRLKASLKLGLKEVPCIIADDLTDEQIKAYRLADNKVSELATWNFEKLEEELSNISLDMLQFGFEDLQEELDNVCEDDFDEFEELPVNSYSKRGDVFVLGRHRLMCGDSTVSEDVKTLVGGSVMDMIFTDPPYNVDYEGTAGKIQNDKQEDNEFYQFLFKAFDNMFNSVKEGGSIYVCHADTEDYGNQCIITAITRMINRLEAENYGLSIVSIGQRIDKKLVDIEAVKEAVYNAVAYNDWVSGNIPAVYMFEDRMEIISHGGLPTGQSEEDFFNGISKPRSIVLTRILRDLGFAERTGHGVPTIVRKYSKNVFIIKENYINVIIPYDMDVLASKNDNVVNNVVNNVANKSLEDMIIDEIKINNRITANELSIKFMKTSRTIQRIMSQSLRIERIGNTRTGYWEVKD